MGKRLFCLILSAVMLAAASCSVARPAGAAGSAPDGAGRLETNETHGTAESAAGSADIKPESVAGSADITPESAAGSADITPESVAGSADITPENTAGNAEKTTGDTSEDGEPDSADTSADDGFEMLTEAEKEAVYAARRADMIIIDGHTHIRNAADGNAPLYELAERLNYQKLALMSTQSSTATQNAACALSKLRHPGITYAFGGLDYITGRDFKTQVENLYAMGYDGVKMLEGKPTSRRRLNRALDDPAYDPFFTFLEEKGFPVLLHVADPHTFWDRDKAPGWAVDNGWLYNENDVPYEQYYTEVENMLGKHPRLRAVFAHFYFLSWDPDRAQRFLDDHPGVYFDVTAGIEMYEDFSKDPAFWRAFFIKNKNRIIFGTDSDDTASSQDTLSLNGYAGMEIEFLIYDRPLEIYGMALHGLGLPEDTLNRIFSENFTALAGGTPRPMDITAVLAEAELVRGYLQRENDIRRMDTVIKALRELN